MTTTAPACVRPGCQGLIMGTGFCDTCGRRPAAPVPPAAPLAPATPSAPAPPGAVRRPARRSTPTVPAVPTTPTSPTVPITPSPPADPSTPSTPAAPLADELDRDGLLVLPSLPSPDLADAVRPAARLPTNGRPCGKDNCPGIIGLSYDGGPAPDHGFCPECGTEYSFRPQLRPGDVVGGHYKVLDYLAVGGHGWIYLAEDTRVPELHVVLKGLINSGDAAARRAAVEERRSLTTLHHPDIVRIITYVQHQVPGDPEPTGYIVMEYVGGHPLSSLRTGREREEDRTRLLGGPFEFGHVITYGCMILGALEYLHDQGLLYCDMKPENVIHYGRRIKLIDLGGIRPIGDRTSGMTLTHGYPPSSQELAERGFHIDGDLFTVGRTLGRLAAHATAPVGLAARSFDALIRRATHPEPPARFGSAAEMSRQLWEVLREHRALAGHEPYPERSTRFEPTASVFGAGLGTVPELRHWTGRTGTEAPELPVGPPDPREAALALPTPIPDTADDATVLLDGLTTDTPQRVAERARQDPRLRTVEAALWLCRAYLDAGDADQAQVWARTAKGWSGDYDWRIFWHQGLVHLTRGKVAEAEAEFMAAYDTLPGESAPKLALGYCAEYREAKEREERERAPEDQGSEDPESENQESEDPESEDPESEDQGTSEREPTGPEPVRRAQGGEAAALSVARPAAEYYEAVRRRDPTQGSAAFGLARIHLRKGERDEAVAVLDEVPTVSRHYDAARVAAVRLLVGRLPGGSGPGAAELGAAAERLAALHLEGSGSWERLVTDVREHALGCRPPTGWGPGFPAGEVFGSEDSPQALAVLLSGSLKRLAEQAGDLGERGALLDRAYAVLPEPPRFRDLLSGRLARPRRLGRTGTRMTRMPRRTG
ncbi:tetratricopeptide repeat protein [Streptomyces sp. NPDC088789]|uniref:tetratricopeptide repeat protein n=1 Tax=Streptomyces sp. NPDC088789 TaxID=3365899 RepID=UPI00380F170D